MKINAAMESFLACIFVLGLTGACSRAVAVPVALIYEGRVSEVNGTAVGALVSVGDPLVVRIVLDNGEASTNTAPPVTAQAEALTTDLVAGGYNATFTGDWRFTGGFVTDASGDLIQIDWVGTDASGIDNFGSTAQFFNASIIASNGDEISALPAFDSIQAWSNPIAVPEPTTLACAFAITLGSGLYCIQRRIA